jgi:hypothetical protein
MDDPTRFGEEVYKLTFQQAVDLKRLVPYKLLVTIVTDEEIAALIRDRKYVDLQGKPIPADDLATAIAVRRAYKELGISRVISYHGNIKRARAFAQLVQEVKTSGKAPEAECVTGAMPVEDRKEALTRLANAVGPYLITNARCLTEGIDVPALDAVAFADPRRSQVDIVQAVGRAMRKPRGTSSKTTGYIILPVFLSKKELKDPETAVEGSAFAPVLQVLRALKAHDPYRATFFAKILVEEGKRPHKKGEGIDEILQVSIGKELDWALAKRLEQAVQLRAVEVAANRFAFWLELLIAYKREHDNLFVPIKYSVAGHRLGGWVNKVRTTPNIVSTDQRKQLTDIGFVWNVHEYNRQIGFEKLRQFYNREGHTLVPKDWREDQYSLGSWISHVRNRRFTIPLWLKNGLEEIGFVWDVKDQIAERNLSRIEQFYTEHGHSNIPQDYKDSHGSLGSIVSRYRSKRNNLDKHTLARLRGVQFQWEPKREKLDLQLTALEAFVLREGTSVVPRPTLESGIRLDKFVTHLRGNSYRLNEADKARLARVGFSWDPYEDRFQEHLTAFRQFVTEHEHARVPDDLSIGRLRLGRWVSHIRLGNIRITPTNLRQLNELGFIWDLKEDYFNRAIAALASFKTREGNTNVPLSWQEQGIRLGLWLKNVKARGVSSKTQVAQLSALGMRVALRRHRSPRKAKGA